MIVQPIKRYTTSEEEYQPKILVVDDDADILSALKDVLEIDLEHCLIKTASNAEQARLLAEEINPDIALLDIKLGQDNGLDLIPELRAIKQDIACIMMTAFREKEYTITAVRHGANDYLYKPVNPIELTNSITKLLQQQRTQREAVEAEQRFKTVFDQATEWLFLINNIGEVIDANQTAMNFISETRNSVLGKMLFNTPWFGSSVEAQTSINSGLSTTNNGQTYHAELNITDHSSELLVFDFYMKPVINERGNTTQIVVECRDITIRKKAEESIKELNVTLEARVMERTKELEQSLLLLENENKERKVAELEAAKASAAKSDFLSRMSHELRTPLNAILGFGQLLDMDSDTLDETQNENVNEIINAGKHLLTLVNEVLDISKIEAGELDVSMEEVSLDDVIKECISFTKQQMEEQHLELVNNIVDSHIVKADFTRLKQVMLNLLSNAIKYNCENGSVTLSVKILEDTRLRIYVSDTGSGLSEEDIQKLFIPFERLNTEHNVEGVGIGLVISKTLVELMGGTIGVDSSVGEGSSFWIELEMLGV